jgi:hypothetical protein
MTLRYAITGPRRALSAADPGVSGCQRWRWTGLTTISKDVFLFQPAEGFLPHHLGVVERHLFVVLPRIEEGIDSFEPAFLRLTVVPGGPFG